MTTTLLWFSPSGAVVHAGIRGHDTLLCNKSIDPRWSGHPGGWWRVTCKQCRRTEAYKAWVVNGSMSPRSKTSLSRHFDPVAWPWHENLGVEHDQYSTRPAP